MTKRSLVKKSKFWCKQEARLRNFFDQYPINFLTMPFRWLSPLCHKYDMAFLRYQIYLLQENLEN